MSTNSPSWRTTALVAAFCLIAGIAVGWAVAPDDDPSAPAAATSPPPRSTPTTATTSTSSTVAESGSTVVHAGDITVTAPEGVAAPGSRITVTPASPPAPVGTVLAPIGPMIDVSIGGGGLNGPVRIEAVLAEGHRLSPTPDDQPMVFVMHWTDGAWDVVPSTFDPRTNTVTVETDDLSFFGFFTPAWDIIEDIARGVIDGFTGGLVQFVEPVECGDSPDDWSVAADTGPLDYCYESDGEGIILRTVNTRRYAVIATVSNGVEIMPGPSTHFAAQLSDLIATDRQTVIGRGEHDSFRVAPGDTATVTTSYDGLSQSVDALVVSAEIIAAIATHMRFGKSTTADELLRLLDLSPCLVDLGFDPVATASGVDDFFGFLTKVPGCLGDEVLREAFGSVAAVILGGIIGLIGSVLSHLFSYIQVAVDAIRGETSQTFVIQQTAPTDDPEDPEDELDEEPEPTPDTDGVWPTGDSEGPHTLYVYLGASFIVPSWVSCSDEFCIAGTADTVYLYDMRDGISDAGNLPIDHPDPIQAFRDAGFSEAQITALFAPGPPP